MIGRAVHAVRVGAVSDFMVMAQRAGVRMFRIAGVDCAIARIRMLRVMPGSALMVSAVVKRVRGARHDLYGVHGAALNHRRACDALQGQCEQDDPDEKAAEHDGRGCVIKFRT